MTERPQQDITLWLLRWQTSLSRRLRSPLAASVLMFLFPVMLAAFLLEAGTGYQPLSKAVLLGLLWLGVAPYLCERAFRHVDAFFASSRALFQNSQDWSRIRGEEISRLQSPKLLWFGLPWAGLITWGIIAWRFSGAPLPVKVWAGVTFFVLFFLSSIGIHGVYVLIRLIGNVFSADIRFNPLHPDGVGGVSVFNRFAFKGAVYVSSGALLYPLAFEVVSQAGAEAWMQRALTLGFAGFFTAALAAGFAVPALQISRYVRREKTQRVEASLSELEGMLSSWRDCSGTNAGLCTDLMIQYWLVHRPLVDIRGRVWDGRAWGELALSSIVPVGIAVFEFVSR